MTLHRFFVPPEAVGPDAVDFGVDQSRQIRTVLRLRPGDEVLALDGSGMEYLVRLEQIHDAVRGRITSRQCNAAEPAVAITLYPALLKGSKLEMVLQKCTEVGVSHFVPVTTSRSVAADFSKNRRSRYQSIIREAAEQSRRGRIPSLDDPLPLGPALRDAMCRGHAVVFWEGEDAMPLERVLGQSSAQPRNGEPKAGSASGNQAPASGNQAQASQSQAAGGYGKLSVNANADGSESRTAIGLFVGPEGGFDRSEVAEARSLGAMIATLGPRILRAETASIVGAALILHLVDTSTNRFL